MEIADERLDAAEFRADLTDDHRRAAIMATRRLDQEADRFRGDPVSSTQALAFPRSGIENARTGDDYPSNTIPLGIELATFELMLAISTGAFSLDDTGLETIDSINVGALNIVPNGRAAGALPANVERYLFDFTEAGGGAVIVRC